MIFPFTETAWFGDSRVLNDRELARAAELMKRGPALEGTIIQVIAIPLRFQGHPEFAIAAAIHPSEQEPRNATGLYAVPEPRIPVVGGKVDFWHGAVLDSDLENEESAFFVLTERSFDSTHNRGMFPYPE